MMTKYTRNVYGVCDESDFVRIKIKIETTNEWNSARDVDVKVSLMWQAMIGNFEYCQHISYA